MVRSLKWVDDVSIIKQVFASAGLIDLKLIYMCM